MTRLDCYVSGCVYNEDKCCCKGDITVEGRCAESVDGTCCGSFREAGEYAARNAADNLHPAENIDVDCEAERCVFNEQCKCTADHIGISGGGACTCGETACSSFRAR